MWSKKKIASQPGDGMALTIRGRDLSPGVYTVRIFNAEKVFVCKVVKG